MNVYHHSIEKSKFLAFQGQKNKASTLSNDHKQHFNCSSTSSKQWFKLAKQITNRTTNSNIPTLIDNDTEATTHTEKANILSTFFCKQNTIDDTNHRPPPVTNTHSQL